MKFLDLIEIIHPSLSGGGKLFCGARPDSKNVSNVIQGLKKFGVNTIVCLMPDHEIDQKSPGLLDLYRQADMEVLQYGIEDWDFPKDELGFRQLIESVLNRLGRGRRIMMHCDIGLGRTGTALACLLKTAGSGGDPVEEVRRIYRARAIPTQAQEEFVRLFEPTVGGRPT